MGSVMLPLRPPSAHSAQKSGLSSYSIIENMLLRRTQKHLPQIVAK
jgi:hypothetical protein